MENDEIIHADSVTTATLPLIVAHEHTNIHHGQTITADDDKPKPRRYFDTIIRWLLYGYVFLLPLWFLPVTFDIIEFNKQFLTIIVAALGLALFLIDSIRTGELPYSTGRLPRVLLALLIVSGISAIFSVSRMHSIFGFGESRAISFVTVASLAVIFYLLAVFARTYRERITVIAETSIVVTLVTAVVHVLGFAIYSNAGQGLAVPNPVGAVSIIVLMGCAFLPIFLNKPMIEKGKLYYTHLVLKVIGISTTLFLVLVANVWQLWLMAFISTMLYTLVCRKEALTDRWRIVIIPALWTAGALFFLITNIALLPRLRDRVSFYTTPSFSASYVLAGKALLKRPFGFGAENYAIAYDRFKPVPSATRYLDSASEVTTMIVEGGILMLIVFVWLLVATVRTLFNPESPRGAVPIAVAATVVLAGCFLIPFSMASFAMYFVAASMMGVASAKVFSFEQTKTSSVYGSVAFVFGLALAALTVFFTTRYFTANIRYLYGTLLFGKGNYVQAFESYGNSILENPADTRVYQSLALGLLADVGRQLRSKPPTPEEQNQTRTRIQNQLDTAMRTIRQTTLVNPADAQTWMAAGYILQNLAVLGVTQADQDAIALYMQATQRDPLNPVTYARIGTLQLAIADKAQSAIDDSKLNVQNRSRDELKKIIANALTAAEKELQRAIELRSDYGFAIYNLAAVYSRQNRTEGVIKEFEKLLPANRSNAGFLFQLGLMYYSANRPQDAMKTFQDATVAVPNYANAHWYLSRIYEERGDLKAALTEAETVLRSNPENYEVKQRVALLRNGQKTVRPNGLLEQLPLDR